MPPTLFLIAALLASSLSSAALLPRIRLVFATSGAVCLNILVRTALIMRLFTSVHCESACKNTCCMFTRSMLVELLMSNITAVLDVSMMDRSQDLALLQHHAKLDVSREANPDGQRDQAHKLTSTMRHLRISSLLKAYVLLVNSDG